MAGRRKSYDTCQAMGFPDHSFRMESSSRRVDRKGSYYFPCTSRRSLGFFRHDIFDHSGRGHRSKNPDKDRNCYPSHHSCRSHDRRCSRSCSPFVCSSCPCCSCPCCSCPCCSCPHRTSRHSRDRTCHRKGDSTVLDSTVKGMAAGCSRFLHTDQSLCNWPAGFQRLISQHSGLTYGPRRLQPESLRPSASYTAGLCS